MDIGKIIGTIVATRKDSTLVGSRLLVVQPLDPAGESIGEPVTAVDIQGAAGYGELVYIVTGETLHLYQQNVQCPSMSLWLELLTLSL